MEKLNTLELAKQGDVKVIAFLLNRQLQPKGITAIVSRQDSSLQVMLEAEKVPSKKILAEWIHKAIVRLDVASIERINIYGIQTGVKIPAWSQEIELVKQIPSVTPATELEVAPKSQTVNPTDLSIKECVEDQVKCEEDLMNLLHKITNCPDVGKPVYMVGLSKLATYLYDQKDYSDIEIIIGGRYKTKIAFLLVRNEKILIYVFANSLIEIKSNYQNIGLDDNFDCVLEKVEKIIIAKNGIKIILKSEEKHSFYLFGDPKKTDYEIQNKLKTILNKRIATSDVSTIPADKYEVGQNITIIFGISVFLIFILNFCSNVFSSYSSYQDANSDVNRDVNSDVYECANDVGVGSTVDSGDIGRLDSCLKRRGY